MPAHVTILAPIDVDDDVMDEAIRHLDRVAERTAPFALTLQGTGTFRPVSPVVFVAVAEDISACERLERDGGVAIVTLDRPPMNAWTGRMHTELRAVFAHLESDPSVRSVVRRNASSLRELRKSTSPFDSARSDRRVE